ncbi:MAG: hypothetical protein ACYTEG_09260 [Planctomycetota bacterium]
MTEEVSQRLAETPDEFSALAAGGVVYSIPPERLQAEKKALLDALRAAPFSPIRTAADLVANTGRPGELSTRRPIVAWSKSEVFELVYPEGSLQISRLGGGREPHVYGISVVKGKDVLYGGAKTSAAIDAAWRRLERAARIQATRRVYKGVESPAKYLRNVAVDIRGMEE